MYCPACNVEYRSGFTVCADCSATLLDGLPPQERPTDLDTPASLVQVCLTDDPLHAELVAATLREEGIETVVRTRFAGGMTLIPAETHWAPGQQRMVLVPSLAEAQARDVVASIGPPEPVATPEGVPSVEAEPIQPGAFTFQSGTRLGATLILAPILAVLLYAAFVVVRSLFQ